MNLNEARKYAGLPEQLNEGMARRRLDSLMKQVDSLQIAFKVGGQLDKQLQEEGGDPSYIKDIAKALNEIEDHIGMMQRSVDRSDS